MCMLLSKLNEIGDLINQNDMQDKCSLHGLSEADNLSQITVNFMRTIKEF